MAGIEVRALDRDELDQALDTLVEAFSADPSWQRVIPVRRLVRPLLTRYYRGCLKDLMPNGNADGAFAGGQLLGVALWYPPGRRPGGLAGRLVHLFPRRKDLDGWLLEGIAVDEAGRGKGIGSALLAHRLAGCTETVRLEATTEASARLYSRHGFVPELGQGGGDLRMTRLPNGQARS